MSTNPLPILVTIVGLYFLIKLRAFFILHPINTAKCAARGLRSKGAASSLMLALAGTLGVGNVFGVSVGIILGGAGSVFWLFVSTVFASVLKYCEVVITADSMAYKSTDDGGGMFGVIKETFSQHGPLLSKVYAFAVLCLSLVMGAALQSGTVAECSENFLDIPPMLTTFLVSLLVLFAVTGGVRIIEKVTAFLIPLTTIIYIILSVSVIVAHFDGISSAVSLIFSEAFKPTAAAGGIFAYLLSSPVREGYCRGILSNEAGAGTSSIAHARSGIHTPATAGIMGIIEVIFDTALLCMLTAFAILLAVPDPSGYSEGMSLILDAMKNTLGAWSGYVLLFCVFAFAYSTVICWYFYGQQSYFSLLGKRPGFLFLLIFLIASVFGFRLGNLLLVSLTDALMLALTVITLFTLIKNSDRIKNLSELGGVLPKIRRK